MAWSFVKTMKNVIAAILVSASLALPVAAGTAANGQPAPAFDLPSRDGKDISLGQYKGDVVMINFWASWCGPCRQEMPLLESMYKTYSKHGFVLIGVNVEPDSNAANTWLKQTPVSFPVLYDTKSKVSSLYDVSVMPSTVMIDRKGNIRMIHHGYVAGDENQYMSSLMQLMKE
jgi:peroxiredoxin